MHTCTCRFSTSRLISISSLYPQTKESAYKEIKRVNEGYTRSFTLYISASVRLHRSMSRQKVAVSSPHDLSSRSSNAVHALGTSGKQT
jgi:hypothetical protein